MESKPSALSPIMEAYLPMMKSAALISAGELGLFDRLASGPLTAGEAARACAASPRGIKALLDALLAFGFVEAEGERYRNGALIAAHFTSASAEDFTPGLLWTAEAWRIMLGMTDAIREGGPRVSLWKQMEGRPGMGALFARYMEAFARYLSPRILDAIELPAGASRMLDIGGSHGLHSVAFCQRHPGLSSVVLDLPESLTTTPSVIERHGMQGRITLCPGDANVDELGGPYDVVLMLSVLHNQTYEQNQRLLGRVARALAPGGLLVIQEYFKGPDAGLFAPSFDLTLLVETGTATLPPHLVEPWLLDAGFSPPRRVDLPTDGTGSLVLARKPSLQGPDPAGGVAKNDLPAGREADRDDRHPGPVPSPWLPRGQIEDIDAVRPEAHHLGALHPQAAPRPLVERARRDRRGTQAEADQRALAVEQRRSVGQPRRPHAVDLRRLVLARGQRLARRRQQVRPPVIDEKYATILHEMSLGGVGGPCLCHDLGLP